MAETLLPLLHTVPETAHTAAGEVLDSLPGRYQDYWDRGLRAKLGIRDRPADDGALFADLLSLLHAHNVDYTLFFRSLSPAVLGDPAPAQPLFADASAYKAWAERWQARLAAEGAWSAATARAMNRVNPGLHPAQPPGREHAGRGDRR